MTNPLLRPSGTSALDVTAVRGQTVPRLWTPPLRELTPDTSYGFDVIDFARDVLHAPLDPWQEWVVIHAGELTEEGRPRFRKVLILVSRQNGKTHLCVVLSLYWMFVDRVEMILGTSTKLEYAAMSWKKAVKLARRVPDLAAEIPKKGGVRRTNGEQHLWRADEEERELEDGSYYKIAPANEEGGRSMTIDRLILDELRQHHDYTAHDAALPAMTAVWDAQAWALSNAGSDLSVVLNDWRDEALAAIDAGGVLLDRTKLGLFEYSAPEDADPTDVGALAQANPNLGTRIDVESMLADAAVAVEKGGAKLAYFRTEHMCIRVTRLDPAVDGEKWAACKVADVSLEDAHGRIAAVLDVSPDGLHATLVAGALMPNGRVRLGVIEAWDGPDALRDCAAELPGLVAELKPRRFGWFPAGPAAALAADLADRTADDPRGAWPPPGVEVEELRHAAAVCMGLSAQVRALNIEQNGDELLKTHVTGAEKLYSGDGWRFTRRGAGHCDGAYATAGVVHLARTMPPPPKPVGKPRLILPTGITSGRQPARPTVPGNSSA